MAKAASAASSLLAGLNIPEVVKGLRAEYVRSATTQTLVVDLFLVYILATGLLQVGGWVGVYVCERTKFA